MYSARPMLVRSPGQRWSAVPIPGPGLVQLLLRRGEPDWDRVKSNQLDLDDALVYFLTDHLGGTTVTLDENGNQIAELRYTAWGETRYSDGTTPTQRKYNGQIEESGGVYFFQSRYYDPYLLTAGCKPDSIIPATTQGTQGLGSVCIHRDDSLYR